MRAQGGGVAAFAGGRLVVAVEAGGGGEQQGDVLGPLMQGGALALDGATVGDGLEVDLEAHALAVVAHGVGRVVDVVGVDVEGVRPRSTRVAPVAPGSRAAGASRGWQ